MVVFFIVCWAGYTFFADRGGHEFDREKGNLISVMHGYRRKWMRRLMERENRMMDVTIFGNHMRSVALFASTTIFIMGGLVAILGSVDKARAIAAEFPLIAEQASASLWELKILLLLIVFSYAFFKFAWGLRQFNYALSLIGAAPMPGESCAEDRDALAERMALVSSLAAQSFNRGIRAYYFGLAALTWVLNPVLFAVASLWVVLVLYRREFHSHTLKALGEGDDACP